MLVKRPTFQHTQAHPALICKAAAQVNSALALGVSINRDMTTRAAGGYMVQVQPWSGFARRRGIAPCSTAPPGSLQSA